MRWCLEKETWDRARADQVEKIAKEIIDSQGEVCVEELIANMKGKATSTVKGEKSDPRATNPHVSGATGNTQSERKQEINEHVNYSEPIASKTWWKKPLVGLTAVVVLALAVFFVWNGTREEQPKGNTVKVVKEVTPAKSPEATKKKVVVTKEEKKTSSAIAKVKPKSVRVVAPKVETQSSTARQGTLSLGYATWEGAIKSGKPDGRGTMRFSSSHRIDSRDPKGRIAEAGDKVEGSYVNGHLSFGKWYKSDGTTETIMLGE